MPLGAQVKGIRGADAQVRSLRDVGEYDVYSMIVVDNAQTGKLFAFAYQVGGQVPGTGITATELETNMRVPNQFVDESMSVYGIAIMVHRATVDDFQASDPQVTYTTTLDDFREIEAYTHFTMHVGGDKPFAEGYVTWFGEGGGIYGMSNANNGEVLANNVPTIAAVRRWEYKLPIGRIEKFWAEFEWLRGGPTIDTFPESATHGAVAITTRLLGVRARAVQ